MAKNIVAAGLADRCEIQLSYAIGVADPTSIMVETFGTGKVANELLVALVREFFDLRPYGLIKMLDLIQPIYRETAAYGHFGREQFPWEKLIVQKNYALQQDLNNRYSDKKRKGGQQRSPSFLCQLCNHKLSSVI